MKRVAALLVALALVACASVSTSRQLDIACGSYADSINALAIQNELGNLSAEWQDDINLIRQTIGPICSGENDDLTPSAALTRVEAALVSLIEAQEGTDHGS